MLFNKVALIEISTYFLLKSVNHINIYFILNGDSDGTRTHDLRRDRAAF